MTLPMIIALGIVILMIVMIMSDKFAFGAPPLVACCLMVICGISTIPEVFAGFVDTNVIMIAGFMAVMAALQKTSLMDKIKGVMANLAAKGGFPAYVALMIVVMLGASVTSGSTGYYVMILTIVSTIPYNQNLPNSKLLMPLGFASGRALIPVSVAFFMGLADSMMEGYTLELPKFSGMVAFMSVGFLIWSLIAYRFLPDFDINANTGKKSDGAVPASAPKSEPMPAWKEYVTYAAFIVSVVGMMMASSLGEVAYILPGFCTVILGAVGVFDFKEVRANVFSPLIIMMASVIGVAGALASTGFTTMVGEGVANMLGGSVNPFIFVLAFCLLTSTCATLTGASIGSLFIFAPLAIATCTSLGINPSAVAAAMTVSAWGGGYLPIDGLPAMVLGMGNYKLSDFLKYTVPMYLCQIVGLSIGAVIMFPM